jgi:hypothetical protein
MREEEKRRQKAYWEIAAAMVTVGYRGVMPGDVERVHNLMREGRTPTGEAGRQIAAALGNYFNEDGGILTARSDTAPPLGDEAVMTEVSGEVGSQE